MSVEVSKRSAEQVLQHHLQVLGMGDVEATMEDYAPEATLFTPDGILHGHDEIQPFFENSVANVLPPGCDFEMLQQFVEGEIAFIVWSAASATYEFPFGTDTFVIREGQIVEQTFAALVKERAR